MTLKFRNRRLGMVLLLGALFVFLLINVVAKNQAQSMTCFVENGVRTQKPEDLSFLEKAKVALVGVTVPRPRNKKDPSEYGLGFQAVKITKDNGEELLAWVIESGSPGPVVLMFHGYAECKDSMLPAAKEFSGLGCTTMLVDFYGGGDSGGNGTSIGYFEASDVAATFHYAQTHWSKSPIILYGFSMGGAAVLRSVSHEKVNPDGIVLEGVYDSLENTTRLRFNSFGLPSWPLADILLFWGGRAWGFDAKSHNPLEYAKSVTCPTLVFHGALDERVSVAQAEAVFLNLSGEKKLETISGLGHEPAALVAKEPWAKAISEFVESIK